MKNHYLDLPKQTVIDMYQKRHEEQIRLKEGNPTQYVQGMENHNNWVRRCSKSLTPFYTFDELMSTNWLNEIEKLKTGVLESESKISNYEKVMRENWLKEGGKEE